VFAKPEIALAQNVAAMTNTLTVSFHARSPKLRLFTHLGTEI
jgi:hypothetical protein